DVVLSLGGGNVGIGTAAPAQQLTITGGLGFANQNAADKRLWSPADGMLRWQTHNSAGAHGFEVGHQGDPAAVHLDTQGASWLTGGNLGVGVAAPNVRLHVVAEDAPLRVEAPGAGVRMIFTKDGGQTSWDMGLGGGRTAGPKDFWLGDGRAVHLVVQDTTGNTGIGTNAPQAKLHVKGDLLVEGTVRTPQGALGTGTGGGTSPWAAVAGG